ncbi:hypothetical protein KC957_04295, partial [Candidatus Saccharibacteria bacterium]|nr:hypothetical protein [Candidatus Saccharibacteria bacterium]
MSESSQQIPKQTAEQSKSRRWFLRGAAAVGVIAVSTDWGEVWKDLFRTPSKKVHARTVPHDVAVYQAPSSEAQRHITPTIYTNASDYLRAAERVSGGADVAKLEQEAQAGIFDRFSTKTVVSIGRTQQEAKWKAFAKSEASRLSGIPQDRLPQPATHYGSPDVEVARYALLKTMTFAAPLPMSLIRAVRMSESGYVAGMSIRVAMFGQEVDNGISDTVHSALVVDCMEGADVRRGVGRQWLRQFSMLLDAHISQSPTTYNDYEFSQLMPDMIGVDQDRLDYPSPGDNDVFNIASTKAARFTEILSGNMILPGDDLFYSPEQAQQELLLRRIIGTFPEVAPGYFE